MREKQIALIGGTSGIGKHVVQRLVGAGHDVHVACRRPQDFGIPVKTLQSFDATSLSELQWPTALDGLIYCPGTILLKPFHRTTTSDFHHDMQVNLFGAVHCLQSAYGPLKAAPAASVVLFSTVAAAQGMPFHASIASAKAAVEGLAKSLAAEWAPNIRVNVIAPSLTDTPLAKVLLADEAKREAAAKRHPMRDVGNADDVAATVDFLLSDASRFMTGQVLRPDGGLSSVRLFS